MCIEGYCMGIFSCDLIVQDYYALDKKSCLEDMVKFLYQNGVIVSVDDFFKVIMERENLMTTGIGRNVAIPHARSNLVKEIHIAVYVLDNELEFNSVDGEDVKVIFMIAVPENKKNEYMKVLSGISNFLRIDENREKLINAKTKNDIFKILEGIKI
ncbi:MAG: PTS sugar transporter subunit IIA [Candidatus Cloacimonadota bacterium]|nr:PTS sugar transporter subunit IIA [Candidatus Cloacimonadota bacterium]